MKARFGTLRDGRPVDAITLSAGDLTVKILTYGAILNDVRLRGVPYGLTLGSSDIRAYEHGPMDFWGALVGPVANRIAGARAQLGGQELCFEPNEGETLLHGGAQGMFTELWQIAALTATSATLTLTLPHGKGGFPGTRLITARYTVEAPATLRLEINASTDAPTLMNIANHSYWNLDGTETTDGHWLQVAAERYLPVDARMIPTEATTVAGTGFDLRAGRVLRPSDAQRYDHNFCLADRSGDMKPAATLLGTRGVEMRMDTTEAGLQVFDAAPIGSGDFAGHRGLPEVGFCGIALEAQGWPDAPNHPEFPSVKLMPHETYRQETRWSFSKR
ncbi:aldose epimerase family protein [Celeribacter neptunius]|uniref:Aldose 1-epimerase n=1 Tax=Celeribacter neptunius TaxID=588602 RepID=A0A1I3UV22_9RHOB|nr:aldose epimerase family protein [Celeribacter neptunius]SFJ86549.1 aldose 1-epimerase [Celeribacter neptunius]